MYYDVTQCQVMEYAVQKWLSCPVWIDSHVYMSGFRTDLSSYHKVVAMHT
jgi:hypothetical protein